MRKTISLFLALCMVITMIMPAQIFAGQDANLEKIIKVVKEKIDVPENLTEFDYSIFTRNDQNVWNLMWNDKNSEDGNLNVSITDDGNIINYYYYKYTNYNDYNKIPKVSKQEAEQIAMNFIRRINPNIVSSLELVENNQDYLIDSSFNFEFKRVEDSVPFYANSISVSVNRNEGYITSYYSNWDFDVEFPTKDNAISYEKAIELYKEKIGLSLNYDYKVEDDKITTYLTYKPKYNNFFIDAKTGEKVQLDSNYYIYYGGSDEGLRKDMAVKELTPQEQSAVDEVAGLLTIAEAEKIARGIGQLELTDDYKVSYKSLNKNWNPPKDMIWSIEFAKDTKIDNGIYEYANVTINATTGEVIGFYKYNDIGNKEAKFDKEQSKIEVEKFLNEFCGEKFKNTVFDDSEQDIIIPLAKSEKLPTTYTFRYNRLVNDIPFASNNIIVNFDAVNGKIARYNLEWFDAEFVSAKNVIPIEEAYDTLFDKIEYTLEYKKNFNIDVVEKIMPIYDDGQFEIKLVYALSPKKPVIVDAINNILLNSNGEPYKEKSAVGYSDVEDSYAKNEINELAEYGIKFDSDKFMPSEKILQKEYLYLISRAIYPYNDYDLTDENKVDEMYKNLIRQEIIKVEEKNVDEFVTREESLKYVIRALKLDKVADISNIFICDFEDSSEISPDLIGYVTIAKGLGIVNGDNGYFNPKQDLTREQSAMIIYNYLK